MDNQHKRVVAVCECNTRDHMVIFEVFFDKPAEFYISTHMKTWRSFFQRVWFALLYIFNAHRGNAWDEVCLSPEDANTIGEAMVHFAHVRMHQDKAP